MTDARRGAWLALLVAGAASLASCAPNLAARLVADDTLKRIRARLLDDRVVTTEADNTLSFTVLVEVDSGHVGGACMRGNGIDWPFRGIRQDSVVGRHDETIAVRVPGTLGEGQGREFQLFGVPESDTVDAQIASTCRGEGKVTPFPIGVYGVDDRGPGHPLGLFALAMIVTAALMEGWSP
jgi:hypothetical protein